MVELFSEEMQALLERAQRAIERSIALREASRARVRHVKRQALQADMRLYRERARELSGRP